MNNHLKQFFLFLGDLAIMNLALYLSLWLRYDINPALGNWEKNFNPFIIVFIFCFITFYVSGLYDLHLAINNGRFFRRAGQSLIIGALLSVLLFYLIPLHNLTPKTNLAIFIFVFTALFAVWRGAFNSLLKSYLPKTALAIIGYNGLVEEMVKELKQKPQLGFFLSFIIASNIKSREIAGTPVFDNFRELPELVKKRKINEIILAENPDSPELRALLFTCLPLKISFVDLAEFYESISGKIPLAALDKMWFLKNLNEGNKNNFDLFKRISDLILSGFLFLLLIPFWLIIAAIIKLESSGPAFFMQTRAGEKGQNFRMIKFRTMRMEDNDQSPTQADDRRITRFGSFLRKARLDETPQVINIIKGEMSFVGPRPERPELMEVLEKQIPFYRERLLVKPGVTGVDQISGEYHSPSYEDTIKKLQYDIYYVKNRSLYLDLSILLKTFATVISREGR
jgi:exopolysaccharide biosynthesis polyprenyl glycosylphosphotransferase